MPRRIDDTGFCGYKLIQDTDAFCYGVDSVLAADICRVGKKDRVLDLCCGNGVISLIVAAKYAPARIDGIDVQEDAVRLAEENAALNGLSGRMSFVCGDASAIAEYFDAASFDAVVCNPPYFEKGRGVGNDASVKDIARHECSAGIVEFMAASSYVLRQGGSMYLVHRPSRLADIMQSARDAGLEPKQLRMVCPHIGEAPNLVLMKFVKGGQKELKVLPDLIVRNADGSFTEEIDRIYGR